MAHNRNPDASYRPTHPELASSTVGTTVSCGCGWFEEIDPNPNLLDEAGLEWYLIDKAHETFVEHLRSLRV